MPNREGGPRAGRWLVRIDTGGTFTDGWARDPGGQECRCKVLSSGVLRARVVSVPGPGVIQLASGLGAASGVLEGFRLPDGRVVTRWCREGRLLSVEGSFRAGEVVELGTGEEAPVVAARLLTSTGPAVDFPPMEFRLATTRGTNALLERKGAPGALLVTAGFEDLLRIRDQRRPRLFALRQSQAAAVFERTIGVRERIAADGSILQPLDEEALRSEIARLASEEISVAAVALVNAYRNPVHEEQVARLLAEAGIGHVSQSHELSPGMRLLARAETAVANAYLGPVMESFVNGVERPLRGETVSMMTSAGFLKGAREYRPVDSLLSGPAGGVVGARAAGNTAGMEKVLSFDMGGTSTDVARISGRPRLGYEQQIGPVRVAVPAVQIETVAAGGGSICRWVNGGLEVGPDSAGANPGPAAYGRGGPFTLTDVNLMLGCMDAERAGIPLSLEAARVAFGDLKAGMLRDGVELPRDEELLEGLRAIAVERMADAIRKVSLREGYDPMEYGLVAFGGAGPQHACAVAEKLGVTDILVPADAGLLSAWGLHRSRRERIVERLVLESVEALERCWTDTRDEMCGEAVAGIGEGSKVSQILFELRLAGQDSSLELGFRDWPEPRELAAAFAGKYRRVYGYDPPAGRTVEVVMSRVVGAEEVQGDAPETFSDREAPSQDRRLRQDAYRTCVIEPGWSIAEGENGSLRLRREAPAVRAEHWSQPVEAELFRCRFENVVEEMGELLRRTAISTNVKERLDYSCALLDADGFLIVNAPHIPVHLGAIGVCVRTVSTGRRWAGGDMLVVNHPAYGGSHLPDITLISPVFDPSGGLVGFVANRAHHAELGGLAPGSMPATARNLEEEGVVIPPSLLFEAGESRFDLIEDLFRAARYPSRSLADNLADLAAQAAANRHGVAAMEGLVAAWGTMTVRRNMRALFERASGVMDSRIASCPEGRWAASDVMDDGSPVCASLAVRDGRLLVDFEGSAEVHPGNLNATPAIVRSAVLYVMRAWVDEDIPLNEGLLESIELRLPAGMLNPDFGARPDECPAVVGGNVETSQRVVDVLLSALGLQANSQGTMNNLLFGNDRFGFYETLGGGSGAGPGWDGMNGTHVHMSNTAVTDPEVLEWRYPVRVREFSLRAGSGGEGRWRGGDGLVREIEFLEKMTVSILAQRRAVAPRGAEGGGSGTVGSQCLLRCGAPPRRIPCVASIEVEPGDRVRMETPGGGGWGIS